MGGETVGEDTVGEDTVGEDTVGEDTVGEDTVGEDTVGKDTVGEDTVGEDTVDEDTVGEDTVGEPVVEVCRSLLAKISSIVSMPQCMCTREERPAGPGRRGSGPERRSNPERRSYPERRSNPGMTSGSGIKSGPGMRYDPGIKSDPSQESGQGMKSGPGMRSDPLWRSGETVLVRLAIWITKKDSRNIILHLQSVEQCCFIQVLGNRLDASLTRLPPSPEANKDKLNASITRLPPSPEANKDKLNASLTRLPPSPEANKDKSYLGLLPSSMPKCTKERSNSTETLPSCSLRLKTFCRGGNIKSYEGRYVARMCKNCKPHFVYSSVMFAAYKGNKNMFVTLVTHGADLCVHTRHGENLLHCAVKGGNVDIVKAVLEWGIFDVNQRELVNSRSPLLVAAKYGHIQVVDLLILNGADMYSTDKKGRNILQNACLGWNNLDMVKHLLQKMWRYTPEMFTAKKCDMEIVNLLMDSGCNIRPVQEIIRKCNAKE